MLALSWVEMEEWKEVIQERPSFISEDLYGESSLLRRPMRVGMVLIFKSAKVPNF